MSAMSLPVQSLCFLLHLLSVCECVQLHDLSTGKPKCKDWCTEDVCPDNPNNCGTCEFCQGVVPTPKPPKAPNCKTWCTEDVCPENPNNCGACEFCQGVEATRRRKAPKCKDWCTEDVCPENPRNCGACEFCQKEVSATGDPHMVNVRGEQFNLWRLGKVELLKIPRISTPSTAVLRVLAYVSDAGHYTGDDCVEAPYITALRVNVKSDFNSSKHEDIFIKKLGGKMSVSLNEDSLTPSFTPVEIGGGDVVVLVPSESHVKVSVGSASIDVIQPQALDHYFLNVAARGLESFGMEVGGVLGLDDHTDVAEKPAHCAKILSQINQQKAGFSMSASMHD